MSIWYKFFLNILWGSRSNMNIFHYIEIHGKIWKRNKHIKEHPGQLTPRFFALCISIKYLGWVCCLARSWNMKTFGYLIKFWMEISLLYCGRNKFFTRNQSVVAVVKISYEGMKHWIGVDICSFFLWIKMQILSVIDPSKEEKITKLRATDAFKLRNFQFIICL